MKKKLTVKKVIPFAILFILLTYFFIIEGPIKSKTDELEMKQVDLETEILLIQPKVTEMNLWQEELDAIYAASSERISIPDYDNIQNIILEMNSIFEDVSDYKITFSDVNIEDNIATRNIAITFSCSNYESLHSRIQMIHDSKFKYQIYNLSIELNRSSAGLGWGFGSSLDSTNYSVTMDVVAYEYADEGVSQ